MAKKQKKNGRHAADSGCMSEQMGVNMTGGTQIPAGKAV